MSLYYEPNSRVKVGNVVFNNVNKVVITESVKEMGDNAVITLPRTYKKLNGKSVLDYLSEGDKVTIELGIDGKYYEEFTGYLDEISSDVPLQLHVDDGFYPLKRNNFTISWDEITLKNLLNYIAPGYTINAPDVNLGAFEINSASTYRVLTALQQQYGFYSYMRGKQLNCQFAFDVRGSGKTHRYKIGNNVKKNNLKYQRAEDEKVKIRGIANQRNGQKLTYETGSQEVNVSVRTLNFGNINLEQLKKNVEETYKRLAFNGYKGNIIGFAMPRTHAGDTMNIIDDNEPDREGNYLIEKTVIKYDLKGGFERQNTLSFKL
jgi:hypothetical protein